MPRSAAAPGNQATSAAVARDATQISVDADREGPSEMRSAGVAFMAPIGPARPAGVNQTDGRCSALRSGAIVLCQREPGIDDGVRIQGNTLDLLLDQPLGEL